MENKVFEAFDTGRFEIPGKTKTFKDIPWSKHPTFEGVELKHILTAKETGGAYSFHLVRIAPNKAILDHIHDPQLETHEVIAGNGVCVNDGWQDELEPELLRTMATSAQHGDMTEIIKHKVSKYVKTAIGRTPTVVVDFHRI